MKSFCHAEIDANPHELHIKMLQIYSFVYASINSSGAHPPPGQPRGICLRCQSRELGISIPQGDPGHLTHVFSKDGSEFIGKDETFVKDRFVRQGLEKPFDVFKGMFPQF